MIINTEQTTTNTTTTTEKNPKGLSSLSSSLKCELLAWFGFFWLFTLKEKNPVKESQFIDFTLFPPDFISVF